LTTLIRAKETFAIYTMNLMRRLLILTAVCVLFLATFSFAQIDRSSNGTVPAGSENTVPDSPSTIQPPQPHALEDDVKFRSNGEVLRSKAFWSTFGGDFLISSFDAEMSHEGLAVCRHNGHPMSEANGNYSRWQLYRYNLPENAAVGVVAFLWVKFRAPNYVLPAFLAYPAKVHISAGLKWYQDCW
jgi:hypothetical protein